MPYQTLSSGLTLEIPTSGTRNWATNILANCFQKISEHDHTGSGRGVKLGASSINANSIDGTLIRLQNNQSLRARNFANSADIDLLKLDSSDQAVFGAAVTFAALTTFSNISITGGTISGITPLGVAAGGTGAGDIVNARDNLGLGTGAPTNGQTLIGNGTDFTTSVITGTANQVIVTNGAGTITLSAPQNLHSAATPQFGGLTIPSITAAAAFTLTAGAAVTLTSAVGANDINLIAGQNISLQPATVECWRFNSAGHLVPIGASRTFGQPANRVDSIYMKGNGAGLNADSCPSWTPGIAGTGVSGGTIRDAKYFQLGPFVVFFLTISAITTAATPQINLGAPTLGVTHDSFGQFRLRVAMAGANQPDANWRFDGTNIVVFRDLAATAFTGSVDLSIQGFYRLV